MTARKKKAARKKSARRTSVTKAEDGEPVSEPKGRKKGRPNKATVAAENRSVDAAATDAADELVTRNAHIAGELEKLRGRKRKSADVKARIATYEKQLAGNAHRLAMLRGEVDEPKRKRTKYPPPSLTTEYLARAALNEWEAERLARYGKRGYAKFIRDSYVTVTSEAPPKKPVFLIAMRVRAELQAQGYEAIGAVLHARAAKNLAALRKWDVSALHAPLRCTVMARLQAMESAEIDEDTGEVRTVRKNQPNKLRRYTGDGEGGRTVQHALVAYLGADEVLPDNEICDRVSEEFGRAFTNIGWYKSMYRAGKLAGMDGQPGHGIQQNGNGYKRRRVTKEPAAKDAKPAKKRASKSPARKAPKKKKSARRARKA